LDIIHVPLKHGSFLESVRTHRPFGSVLAWCFELLFLKLCFLPTKDQNPPFRGFFVLLNPFDTPYCVLFFKHPWGRGQVAFSSTGKNHLIMLILSCCPLHNGSLPGIIERARFLRVFFHEVRRVLFLFSQPGRRLLAC